MSCHEEVDGWMDGWLAAGWMAENSISRWWWPRCSSPLPCSSGPSALEFQLPLLPMDGAPLKGDLWVPRLRESKQQRSRYLKVFLLVRRSNAMLGQKRAGSGVCTVP